MSLNVRIRKQNSLPVIKITGDISGEDSVRLARKILSGGREKARAVVLDLSETTFIDSHGLGAIIYAWRMLEQSGSKLVLLDPPAFVHTLIQGTNLASVITVVESMDSI
jgi:anti-anti-sigma factor